MTKEEFEKLAGVQVTPEDYKDIEFVYTWHPSISETDGKRQIATLWNIGGLRLILDMKESAMHAKAIDDQIREVKEELVSLERELTLLKEGQI